MCFYTWKITLYPKSENSKGICCPTPPYQSPSHPDPQEGRKCFSLAPSRRKSSRYGLVWASTRLVGFWRVFLHLVCKIKPSMRRKKKHTSSSALHLSYPIYVPCPDVGDVGMSGFVSKLGTPKPLCFLNSLGPSLRNPNRRSNWGPGLEGPGLWTTRVHHLPINLP